MTTAAELSGCIIRVCEGSKLKAYWDRTGKRWTIGRGHTRTAHQGMTITEQQEDELYAVDSAPLILLCANRPVVEAAALVSFGYNCGAGALRRLLAGDIRLSEYGRTSGGVPVPGLAARRDLEAALIGTSSSNETRPA